MLAEVSTDFFYLLMFRSVSVFDLCFLLTKLGQSFQKNIIKLLISSYLCVTKSGRSISWKFRLYL